YILFPVLERVLLTFPGAYSFWLRLWGSKIGAKVYWSPTIEVVDRTHLHIGNNVFMGSKIHFCSHVVRPNDDRLFLYVKKIEIGDNVFIGAGSRFGPGSKVAKGVMVPLLTDLKVNEKIYE
ncbi:MAG: hypothetical protein Q7U04_08175, partial [Bacteriovorax sp.]|nr:hypothetical protein [Bacteriovorax sp.]